MEKKCDFEKWIDAQAPDLFSAIDRIYEYADSLPTKEERSDFLKSFSIKLNVPWKRN